MMIGDRSRSFPSVQIPQWDPLHDPTVTVHSSPFAVFTSPSSVHGGDYSSFVDSFAALRRYLPFNDFSGEECGEDLEIPAIDAYSCDQFRMFEFKVRRCVRVRSHDWTECPYAHPGEKARRRDPRRFHYSGTACPEFRKVGGCKRGDTCEFAHGVFECWLHPARYRTLPCKDGPACRRRVCFFAHSPEQLRVLTQHSPRSEYGSPPIRHVFVSPPISPPSESPPDSPLLSDLVASVRNMRLSPSSWVGSRIRPGSYGSGLCPFGEEPAMERVESGRDLRAKLYARLSKENSLDRLGSGSGSEPDIGWVSELV